MPQFQPTEVFSKRVVTAFKQGHSQDYNCGPISVVKCAIATFGPENKNLNEPEATFTSDVYADGRHQIVLRNGAAIELTDAEIAEATQTCGFTQPTADDGSPLPGDETIKSRAIYIYAALAKSLVAKSEADPKNFPRNYTEALNELARHGHDADDVAPLLGLSTQSVPANTEVAYLFGNYYHATFATGDQYDEYGVLEDTADFERLHHSWHHNNQFWSLLLVSV